MRHGDSQRVIRSSAQVPLSIACAAIVLIFSTLDARANDPAHAIADKFAVEAERARQRDVQPKSPVQATVDAERNAALKAAEAKRAADAKKVAEQKKKAAAKKLIEAEQQRKADQADQAAMVEQVRRELEELKAEEARAAEADRVAAEQSRQAEVQRLQALAEAEAAARRAAEVEAALEAEAKRRVLAERAAREAREREAEARRIAEAEAEQRRLAEQAATAKAAELQSARQAEEQRRLAEEAAALRDEEGRRLAERLARQRDARLPPPDTRPLEPETTTREPKPVDVARQEPAPAPSDAAPPKTVALGTRDPVRGGDADKAGPRRVTVLLSIRPGDRGIRRFEKSADPVLCAGATCYIGMGAGQDAKVVSRNAALGTANTLGGRAGACNRSLTCVFRNIELGEGAARLQPIDLKIMRHDRRTESEAVADATCTVNDGKLECGTPVVASDYRLWIVPEDIARKAGPDELATAVVARLQASD